VVVVSQRRAVLSVADTVVVMRDGLIDRVAQVDPATGRAGIAAAPGAAPGAVAVAVQSATPPRGPDGDSAAAGHAER
jgi:hypothetical protein